MMRPWRVFFICSKGLFSDTRRAFSLFFEEKRQFYPIIFVIEALRDNKSKWAVCGCVKALHKYSDYQPGRIVENREGSSAFGFTCR